MPSQSSWAWRSKVAVDDNFVLIHSPLIGPYSWRPVANELEHRDYRTSLPSLLPALAGPANFAEAMARRVKEAVRSAMLPEPIVLVAHSAAGAYLPLIGSVVDREIRAYLFVDARLPERGASLADQDPPELEEQRQKMAREGMLPPWSEWFGEGALVEVIPDDEQRQRFAAELRPVPLALFHEKIPYPMDWPAAPCGYLRLSAFYKPLAQEATERGWRVMEIDAEHLHMMTRPQEVTELLLKLLNELK